MEKDNKKEFEDYQKLQVQVLETNSLLNGINTLKGNYGQKGEEIANNYMKGQEVLQMKEKLMEEQKEEAKKLGINYEPEMPTNYQLIKNSKKMVDGALQTLNFGNLEKIAKAFMPGLEFEVPEFKDKTYMDYLQEIQKSGGDEKKIDQKTKDALQYHQILSSAYTDGTALALMQNSYMGQYNEMGKQLAEKYNPKEEGNGKGKKIKMNDEKLKEAA